MKPVDEKKPDNYTLTRTDTGGSVSPKGPLNQLGLVPEVTTRYKPEWNGNNRIMLVPLDDEDAKIGTYGSPASEDETEEEEGEESS